MSGYFITFEGGEGTGKSTQSRLLVERLERAGLETILTREPGGSPAAERLREILVSGETDKWSLEAETLLFFAARDDHLRQIIRPALDRGNWVICDRFADSTRAYQGAAGADLSQLLETLEKHIIGDTWPAVTFLLDLDPDDGLARASTRDTNKPISNAEDRFERKGKAFHRRLRQAFLNLARSDPERIVVMDAALAPDVLSNQIWDHVVERWRLTGNERAVK